jgi:hypothetical protein
LVTRKAQIHFVVCINRAVAAQIKRFCETGIVSDI